MAMEEDGEADESSTVVVEKVTEALRTSHSTQLAKSLIYKSNAMTLS